MASTFQYWRLLFNSPPNGGSSSFIGISEWTFYDSNFNQISTAGGTATAVSSFTGLSPANAFDGNINTVWAPAVSYVSGQWLQMQFSSAVSVCFITITNRNDSNWTTQSPTGFSIQGSPDGSTWTTLETYSGVLWLYGQGYTQQFDASTTVGNLRASQVAIEVVADDDPSIRTAQMAIEVFGGSNPKLDISQVAVEVFGGSNPHILASQLGLEVIGGANPDLLLCQLGLEVMFPYVQDVPGIIMQCILP